MNFKTHPIQFVGVTSEKTYSWGIKGLDKKAIYGVKLQWCKGELRLF